MKNRQHGFVFSLIILIIAILAVGGGMFLYSQKKGNPEKTLSASSSTVMSVISQPIEDRSSYIESGNTAAWKIYESPELKISFKMPADWVVTTDTYQGLSDPAPYVIGLSITSPHKLSADDFIGIGGHMVGCESYFEWTKCNMRTLGGVVYTKTNNADFLRIYDEVVASIEALPLSFAEKTAGWKTYKNTSMGIEFKYFPAWSVKEDTASTITAAPLLGYEIIPNTVPSEPNIIYSGGLRDQGWVNSCQEVMQRVAGVTNCLQKKSNNLYSILFTKSTDEGTLATMELIFQSMVAGDYSRG